MHRLTASFYSKEFSSARLVSYAVVYGMLALSLVLPIHYACSETAPCPGCGFREAMSCLVHLDLTTAASLSPFALPAALVAALSLADVIAIAWHRLR